jgi:hypothetical protein
MQENAAERCHFGNQDYWSVRKDGQIEICFGTASCVCTYFSGRKVTSTLMWFKVKLCAKFTLIGGLYVCFYVVESRVKVYIGVDILCVSLCSG